MKTVWNDDNRFSQMGYSASTIFPLKENYQDQDKFKIDMDKAEFREQNRNDWLDELKYDAMEEMAHEQESEED